MTADLLSDGHSTRYKCPIYFWGAPPKKDREAFESAVVNRFRDEEKEAKVHKEAFRYIEEVLNRQINKARGLVSFNSILVAAVSFTNSTTTFAKIAVGVTLTSCLVIIVSLMWVLWRRDASVYASPIKEFKVACSECYMRSYAITLSIILSILSAILAFTVIAFRY